MKHLFLVASKIGKKYENNYYTQFNSEEELINEFTEVFPDTELISVIKIEKWSNDIETTLSVIDSLGQHLQPEASLCCGVWDLMTFAYNQGRRDQRENPNS